MRINSIVVYFAFLLVLLGTGCRKSVFVTPKPTKKKIVVNSIFTHDQQLQLNVTSTKNHNESQPLFDNLNIRLLSHQFSKKAAISYQTPDILTDFYPDDTYTGYFHLSVSADGYDTVYAVANIPKPIIVSATFEDSATLYNRPVFKIKVSITDAIEKGDYYMMDVRLKKMVAGLWDVDPFWEIYSTDTRTENQINSQTPFDNYRHIYLSDEYVDSTGPFINTFVFIESSLDLISDPSSIQSASVELRVRRVSKDLYEHALSIDQYYEKLETGPIFEKEYIEVYSNVSGGYGVFAGYSEETFEFQIKP